MVLMRWFALIGAVAFVGACTQEGDITGSTDSCAAELYPVYDPKVLQQCVAVCRKCQHGIATTCSTSCALKGAR